ncbi:MAG: FAD-dependent oxidoreductase [Candidatus Hodarchaeales archaeon]|jgi:heterodisulfide reductase subunit A
MMETKVGSIAVIGGGIAGIQTSIDLAEQGFLVYLMEKEPSIGGRMVQLDKTFPTLDCAMCILGPKLVDVQRHPNIKLLTYCEPSELSGTAGNFTLKYLKKARYVDENLCTGCGECEASCPYWVDDDFNANLTRKDKRGRDKPGRKNISIPFPQAVPKIAYIVPETCRYLISGKCGVCKKKCGPGAIDYEQQDEEKEINIGAVIVTTGFDPFNAKEITSLHFGEFPNVVTTLQFERLLNASGPTEGEVIRPSDQKHPKKIAFLQCVGSRNPAIGKNYCSAACCMHAVKEAIMAKEHDPNVETYIYYMDIRAFGKGFEEFYQRAINEFGVKFIKSRVSEIRENPENRNLIIKYENFDSDPVVESDEMDLVVLTTGLDPSSRSEFLESKLQLELTDTGFVVTDPLNPLETNREGVYVCGVASGPKDIPDTVANASGAAAKASILLKDVRGTEIEEVKLPREIKVDPTDEPRVGVLICHCGHNIGSIIDCKEVADYAATLANVTFSSDPMYACAADSQVLIKEAIKEHNLNRLIVASCTPRTHEPLFRSTLQEAGLNEFLFDLVNLREQVSWVHPHETEKANEKAKDLVRGAITRACRLEPLFKEKIPINQKALVIGGGVAGMTSALDLARAGYPVHLVEKEDKLGGELLKVPELHNGLAGPEIAKKLISQVNEESKITVYTNTEFKELSGAVGNFKGKVNSKEIDFGAVVLATGAKPFVPDGYYSFGEAQNVITQQEFEERFDDINPKNVVMIQCVGSREDESPRTYCSRICCTVAIKNSIKIKERNPEANVFILYKDIRTYGDLEDLYLKSRELGTIFIRYTDEKPPVVNKNGLVEIFDEMLSANLHITPDLVLLSVPLVPKPNEELSQMFKVPRGADQFFLEAHVKLRPIDFATDGIFLAGTSHFPKFTTESIFQGSGAAVRVMALLAKGYILSEGAIAEVNQEICRGCGRCEEICPFKAIELETKSMSMETTSITTVKAYVNEAVCKGCGTCVVTCPVSAISVKHFPDEIIEAQFGSILEKEPESGPANTDIPPLEAP